MKVITEVYAKSALCKPNINAKNVIGHDGIEIQLLSELVNGKLGEYFTANEAFNLSDFDNENIKVVHAPILSHYGLSDVNVETLCDGDFKLLDQVFYIADYFGKKHNRQTIIVVHSENFRENMMLLSDTWKRVLNCIGCLLLKYSNTEVAIENVTPIREIKNGTLHLCNNFMFDNVDMVSEIRKQLNTTRVGTVLDTCHAEMARMTMKVLMDRYPEDIPNMDLSMNNYFKQNAGICKLIHMSATIDSGIGKGKHGMPFSEEYRGKMEEYLSLYNKYNYTCPITLEVAETNFLKCDGYRVSKEMIDCYR